MHCSGCQAQSFKLGSRIGVAQVEPQAWLMGIDCNVSSPAAVHRLADAAVSALGSVDVWINNAGYSGSYQVLVNDSAHRPSNP